MDLLIQIEKYLIHTLGCNFISIDLFKKVNGYSNEYWGWGFEDDDLLMRLTEQHIFTDTKYYEVPKLNTSGIYLHGDESYIQCPNQYKFKQRFYNSYFIQDIQMKLLA